MTTSPSSTPSGSPASPEPIPDLPTRTVLAKGVDPYVVSLSQAVAAVSATGIPWEYIPSQGATGLRPASWRRMFADRLDELLRRVRPDVLVFDGTHPYSGLDVALVCGPGDDHGEADDHGGGAAELGVQDGALRLVVVGDLVFAGAVALAQNRPFDRILAPASA